MPALGQNEACGPRKRDNRLPEDNGVYGADADKYYCSPYGVFVAGAYFDDGRTDRIRRWHGRYCRLR